MLPINNMRGVWNGSVNLQSLYHGSTPDADSHQPHDVYLRHLLQPLPNVPQPTKYHQDPDIHLLADLPRRSSSNSNLSEFDEYRSSLQSQIQRSQFNTSSWLAGYAAFASPLDECSGNQYLGWLDPHHSSGPVQYAPWDVSVEGKARVTSSTRDAPVHSLENTFSGPSLTPTISEYSGSSYSIASANSSFAPSPEEWHQRQMRRSDPADNRNTSTRYNCHAADGTNLYPQRCSRSWEGDDSYWPVCPDDNSPMPSSFTGPDYGPRMVNEIASDVTIPNDDGMLVSHIPYGLYDRRPVWNNSAWSVGRHSALSPDTQQSRTGTTVTKRTPQQARDEAQDESDSSVSVRRTSIRPRKRTSTRRPEEYETTNARLGQREDPSFMHVPAEKNYMLVCWRRAGLTYKEIKIRGNFHEAESTLRGRFRALTKEKHQRLRAPVWERKDEGLLRDIVNGFADSTERGTKDRVPWKKVAELIIARGGTYLFGPGTCKKKWEELALMERDGEEADDSQVEG